MLESADSASVLEYQGYGSIDGSNDKINPPDMTITTAADLLMDLGGYKFKVVYSPDNASVEGLIKEGLIPAFGTNPRRIIILTFLG